MRGPRKPDPFAVKDFVHVYPTRTRGKRGPRDGRWYWRARITAHGHRRTVWSGWATRDEAWGVVADLVQTGAIHEPKEPVTEVRTLTDLMECWVGMLEQRADLSAHGLRAYSLCARHLKAQIGEWQVERVGLETLEEHRNRRLAAKGAPATVRQEIKALRAAWRWGKARGLTPERDLPSFSIKPTPVRTRYTPSRKEVLAVLAELNGWPRIGVLLLFATGARIGEVAVLRWSDVRLEDLILSVDGKTGPRDVPIAEEVARELRAWRAVCEGDLVLGVKPNTARAQLGTKFLKRGCSGAGVRRFTANGLRRAAVDEMQRAGVDIGSACAVTGHSPQVMLQHYRQATMDDKRRAVAAARLGIVPRGDVVPFPEAATADGHSVD